MAPFGFLLKMASIFFLNDISYMVEMYNNIRADGTHQLVNIKLDFAV